MNEFANAIGAGADDLVLLCGAEAISTVRHLARKGEQRDWSESIDGQLEDRGFGDLAMSSDLIRHGARTAISLYALFENARRARLGMSRAEYALEMGRLCAPFTAVAATNPHAMAREVRAAQELAAITPENRLTSDPYTRRLVSRDQTNQGAAVLLTSRGRLDLSSGPASILAARAALEHAGLTLDDLDVFDFYSCFPIAVFNARDGLGIAENDPRPLTVTGGPPFFGGAGNNYSMHAIASMVRRLRAHPNETGLVAANGGALSKYSVGVYAARPRQWRGFDSAALQAQVDGWPAPPRAAGDGEGTVETYTIDYSGKTPTGVIVGRLDGSGARFVAMTDGDASVLRTLIEDEPLGARVEVRPGADDRSVIRAITPVSQRNQRREHA